MGTTKTITPGFRARIHADRTDGERVKRYDPETGEGYLADPSTWRRDDPATWVEKPWPATAIELIDGAPASAQTTLQWIRKRQAEGLVVVEGERPEHRPGGPPDDLWRVTHTFIHIDALVLKTTDGDVRYRVVRQPDKYVAGGADEDLVTPDIYAAGETDVAWFYLLELEG